MVNRIAYQYVYSVADCSFLKIVRFKSKVCWTDEFASLPLRAGVEVI